MVISDSVCVVRCVSVGAIGRAGPSAMEEDDEGWTVVKRHRRT